MTLINVISAIGNNNSIAPLLVRDCGLEVPSKIAMTYYQNRSDKYIAHLAAREKFVDEYSTSAVWLGGVPLIGEIANWCIKKLGYNPDINSKLLKEEELQGLQKNIEKFRDKAPEAVAEMEKVAQNVSKYKKALAGKFLAQTIIPISLIGWVIPKAVFAWTASTKAKRQQDMQQTQDTFIAQNKTNEKIANAPSFKGVNIGSLADLSNLEKLIITDTGYAIGRVSTARKRNEAYDLAVRMAGMLYLNYKFPKQFEKVLNAASEKLLETNMDLDVKLLADKEFLKAIETDTLILPKSNNAKDLLEFVDNNPNSLFTKYANQYEKIKMLNENTRDPRAYVDFKVLGKFRDSIENFSKMAKSQNVLEASQQVNQFAKKAKAVKCATILTNILTTSSLLALGLPKFQFIIRELITGSKLEPGIID